MNDAVKGKMFKLMHIRQYDPDDMIRFVPWGFVEPHEQQALKNHDQTLETLNRRGGLCCCEMLSILEDRRFMEVDHKIAYAKILKLLEEYNRKTGSKTSYIAHLTNKYLKRYYKGKIRTEEEISPPQNAPTEFWLSVLYYQKMFNSGPKYSMGGVVDFSHLSVHAELELEEMVKKDYPDEWFFWMFDEIGWFTPEDDSNDK